LAVAARRHHDGGDVDGAILGVDLPPMLAECLAGLGRYRGVTAESLPAGDGDGFGLVVSLAGTAPAAVDLAALARLLAPDGRLLLGPAGSIPMTGFAAAGLAARQVGSPDPEHGIVDAPVWLCRRDH
jgi:hypothetical protein